LQILRRRLEAGDACRLRSSVYRRGGAIVFSSSRLSRWKSDGEGAHPARRGPAADSGLPGRAQAALETAMIASRSANDRREREHRRVQSQVGLTAAIGAAGLAGLFGLVLVSAFDRAVTLGLASVCAVLAAAAAVSLARTAWMRDEAVDVAAAAGDLALGAQAKQLAELATALDGDPAMRAGTVLERLIGDVEDRARAARDREAGLRGSAAVQGRRHERIVPRQTRTAVTTADGRSLNARIIDISQSGVALEGNFPGCAVGHRLQVGSHAARVVRVLARGLACEFIHVLPAGRLAPEIVL
jgi:hypothetical protein